MERMKAAALRLGGQGLTTSYDDHLLIIGDAAGHIDPLTGEGIHTAIMVPAHPPIRLILKFMRLYIYMLISPRHDRPHIHLYCSRLCRRRATTRHFPMYWSHKLPSFNKHFVVSIKPLLGG